MTLFSADSHPGHKRSRNEDCYEASPELGLFLVADGVGGHADGEVASAIVRDTLRNDRMAGENLVDAIHHSHQAVLDEIDKREDSNMGSTVVAMQLSGHEYEIAWVGDSRAYLFDGKLRQITRDHNPVSEMVARGAITPEQASRHPERNVLSQSLGVSNAIRLAPGRIRGEFEPGQQFILCSDGLTDELSDEQISEIMREHGAPQEQVEGLISAALEAGGRDNVTVIVIGDKNRTTSCEKKALKENHSSLGDEIAVGAEPVVGKSSGGKVLLLLALLGGLAVLWVVLRIL